MPGENEQKINFDHLFYPTCFIALVVVMAFIVFVWEVFLSTTKVKNYKTYLVKNLGLRMLRQRKSLP